MNNVIKDNINLKQKDLSGTYETLSKAFHNKSEQIHNILKKVYEMSKSNFVKIKL